MAELATIVLNGTTYVLILILVALGLVVVFGMMRVINMAHGELFMLGAYVVVVARGVAASRSGSACWRHPSWSGSPASRSRSC